MIVQPTGPTRHHWRITMIDYGKLRVGDKLKIVGLGAPGFAALGDIVTVESCNGTNRCDVVHDQTGARAYFALTCGAGRLEHADSFPEYAVALTRGADTPGQETK